MRTEVRYRVAVAGAELRMLVLASQPDGCVGIDLDSGAFVRALFPGGGEPLEPFDVTSAPIGDPVDPPDTVRPEAVALERPPARTGSLSPAGPSATSKPSGIRPTRPSWGSRASASSTAR